MKKISCILVLFIMFIAFNVSAKPANTNFNDDNFYKCIIDRYNTENKKSVSYDTNLTDEELTKIKRLECYTRNITDAKGIEKLTSVTYINFNSNNIKNLVIPQGNLIEDIYMSKNPLESIDLTYATKLKTLSLSGCNLENINLTKATNLTKLYLDQNKLTSIDLTKNTKLDYLTISDNNLSALNITKNTLLTSLTADSNNLETVDVSNNTLLERIYLSNNKIKTFDVTHNPELKSLYLDVPYNVSGELTSIDLTKNTKLIYLNLDYQSINSINLTNNTELERIRMMRNKLTSINVTKNTKLEHLYLNDNKLTSIDLSKNTLLQEIALSENKIISVDVTKMTDLSRLSLESCGLTSLDLSNNSNLTYLDLYNNDLTTINLKNKPKLWYVNLYDNNISEINTIGSDNIKELLISSQYTNNNVKTVKLGNVSSMTVLSILVDPINTFEYQGDFDKLKTLYANSLILKKIDFSKTPLLSKLYISGLKNKNDLNISIPSLTNLAISDSSLDVLDLSSFPNLVNLTLETNYKDVTITNELIVSNNKKLEIIDRGTMYDGKLTIGKLDLSQNKELKEIELAGDVKNLILGNSDKLNKIYISSSNIERLVLSGYPNLKYISLVDNDKLRGVDLRGINPSEKLFINGFDGVFEYIYTDRNTRSLTYSDFDSWFGNVDIVVGLKTTKKEFNKMFKEIKDKSIMNKQGTLIGDDDILKTGDILYKNPYRYKNYIVVKGDVTGNGSSTVSDVAKLYQYLKGKITMDKEYVIAGNVVDTDDVIKINDVAKLYQYIKGKISSIF